MWQAIAGIVQIIFLILKNKTEKNEEKKKEREAKKNELKEAVKSKSASAVNSIIDSL